MPDGYGVFEANEWVHFGRVKDGLYQEGRMVSANISATVLKLTNIKFQGAGNVFKKIERFSPQGVEKDFFKDGHKKDKIIPRLNRSNDA